MDAVHLDSTVNAANPRAIERIFLGLELSPRIPELPAKQQKIRGVLLGALGHFLRSVPQPVEAVVDVFNQLSAGHELSLDVGGEVFLRKNTTQLRKAVLHGEQFVLLTKFTTNLGSRGNPVGHELVSCSLIGITQLRLDVLQGEEEQRWTRLPRLQARSHRHPGRTGATYGAVEGEEGLQQLVL